jgi:hypothetical protein
MSLTPSSSLDVPALCSVSHIERGSIVEYFSSWLVQYIFGVLSSSLVLACFIADFRRCLISPSRVVAAETSAIDIE